MKFFSSFFSTPATVKLEIVPNFLASLLASGHIHVADFRCLDLSSKQIVWKLLLSLTNHKGTENENHLKLAVPASESVYPSQYPGELDHV
ncbi:hypothetical protein [Methylosarcina fibrata]|uniref:hypothetical protein n=1 Tax=Methylosarcina fibrata TaxID=105972 RepID=UPI000360D08B|nr:hypothetical protein [Methylosarcina fibrata]